jgi:hypothetical protein
MGQFSYCCAACDQEILHGHMPGYNKFTHAVVLWPNGDRISGEYDGYGRIGSIEGLQDQHGGWRIVHQSCLSKLDLRLSASAMFAGFKPEAHASDQGWWPGERLAIERYGEPDMSELTKEQTYVCTACRRTWKANWSGGVCPFGCERPADMKDYRELVEAFAYIDYEHETADGLAFCHNETVERTDWKKWHATPRDERDEENKPTEIEPCFYFGEPQQVRINKPKEWDEFCEGRAFEVRCRGCKTTEVEIVPLTPSELPKEGVHA